MMIGRATTVGPAASSAQGRMPSNRRSEDTSKAGPAPTPGTALVPQTPSRQEHAPFTRLPRSDAAFITHLIATAQQAPQTRNLRRASPADAMAGYRAATQTADAALGAHLTSRLV